MASNQEVLAGGLTRAENRYTAVKEAVRHGQVELRGTAQEHDLDGAVVDLRTANRNLHTHLLETLGEAAGQKNASQAEALVQRGKGLLDVQGRFAEAA